MYLIIDINEAPHRSQGKLEEWVIIKESPVYYMNSDVSHLYRYRYVCN